CRLSDHALVQCHADFCSEAVAAGIFDRARAGSAATSSEHSQFASFMMVYFGRLDAQAGWTKQLHLGALRNTSTRAFRALGPDTGFDSTGDWPQMQALAAYLDRLEQEGALPRVILYNADPRDNYGFATLAGSFQNGLNGNGNKLGRIQFGSAWWFLD